MPLIVGSTLGTYEIVGSLGAGGMGEVYLARDTKLGRRVALKVLPQAFVSDPDRIARLEREAKMLAVINHPRIAGLHSFEHAAGHHFLVMELVDGETLAERLQRGPLQVKDALRIAQQIAEALEAAHEKGVVHRDLKPANVKITSEESVKVLDFGLAKAVEPGGAPTDNVANSPTLSVMATQAGMILGTAAYMSPEQAKGLPADQRSDIFSFGSVLYELLTGRPPFPGETAPDILASVLVREADLQALPAGLHPRIRDLVARCLDKQPKRRWQAAGDLRAEIETIRALPPDVIVAAQATHRWAWWQHALLIAFAVVAASLGTAAVIRRMTPSLPAPIMMRFVVTPNEGQAFTALGSQFLALSPDGRDLVFVANGGLFRRPMSELSARPIPGVEIGGGLSSPAFSPDGRSVLFWAPDGTIRRISLLGGAATVVCNAAGGNLMGLSWTRDGIVFGAGAGVMRVGLDGGEPALAVKVDPGQIAYGPQLLPGGENVIFTLSTGVSPELWDQAVVVVQNLKTGARKRLVEGGADARYLKTGHLVYALGGTLYGKRFDTSRLEMLGDAVPIIEGVLRSFAGATAASQFSVSETGTLVYVPGPAGASSSTFDLALADRKGSIEALHLSPGAFSYPRMSPQGSQVAFGTDEGKDGAVWIYDLQTRSTQRRLTFGGRSRFPVWSPDGTRIAYQSNRDGAPAVYIQRADGTGPVDRVTTPDKDAAHIPESWSPDGAHLLFSIQKAGRFTLGILSVATGQVTRFGDIDSGALPTSAFSPTGKWVAYAASVIGANDTAIIVEPFPPTGAKYQLFAKPGDNPHHPVWSGDGKELFYVPRVGGFESVSVTTSPTIGFGVPKTVPRAFPLASPSTPRTFDLTIDGRIISAISASGMPGQNIGPIRVVTNWFDELNAKVPPVR